MVLYAKQHYGMSLRQACKMVGISSSVYYYEPCRSQDGLIREQLCELATVHTTWGFGLMFDYLRSLNYKWNHKRVYRVYTEMKLNKRRKYKRRLPARVAEPLQVPSGPNCTWSMDFMHDTLSNGVRFRSFNIIDDFNREALNITIDTSLTAKRVIRELDQLLAWRGSPQKIRVDNGPEFIAEALQTWASSRSLSLKFIQKGKPYQNGYVERFNRTFREEVLDAYCFNRLSEAQVMAHAWMWMYNNERPHSALDHLPPTKYLLKYGKRPDAQGNAAFPTFQQDSSSNNNNWKDLVLQCS